MDIKLLLILLACLFFVIGTKAQPDEDLLFLQSKGTWHYPIDSISKIQTLEDRIHLLDGIGDSKAISFYCNNSSAVKAVYEGKVVLVNDIDDLFFVLTKFGNYFIGYSGIIDPKVKKGDCIKKGDLIGFCGKNFDDVYGLDLYLNINSEELSPTKWFVNPTTN